MTCHVCGAKDDHAFGCPIAAPIVPKEPGYYWAKRRFPEDGVYCGWTVIELYECCGVLKQWDSGGDPLCRWEWGDRLVPPDSIAEPELKALLRQGAEKIEELRAERDALRDERDALRAELKRLEET